MVGNQPSQDSHVVQLLRDAGAVLIGKANMDEWAGMRSSVLSTGYSARGGQCRNPYDLSRTPGKSVSSRCIAEDADDHLTGGSSSGSAVAVAANLVPLAIGTETDGSIIGPAMSCGIVGIKPTVGLTSRSGVIPISSTQDTVGPLARTVADAAFFLDAITGPDPKDSFTIVPEAKREGSYSAYLADRSALKGARFGLPRHRFWDLAPPPQRQLVEHVLDLIRSAGAEIHDVDMPCASERISDDGEWDWLRYNTTHPDRAEFTVMKVQAYNGINAYLDSLPNTTIRSVEDIMRFNTEHNTLEGGIADTHPAFPSGQDLFEAACASRGAEDETYTAALRHIRTQTRQYGIDAALQQQRSPDSSKPTSFDALLFCDIKFAGVTIAAQAGYPIITVPVGTDHDGMPVSISLQHTAWQEGKLIRYASAIEDLLATDPEPGNNNSNSSSNSSGTGQQQKQKQTQTQKQKSGRVPPSFKNWSARNIPVAPTWRYPGAPGWNDDAAENSGGSTTGRDAQVITRGVERGEE